MPAYRRPLTHFADDYWSELESISYQAESDWLKHDTSHIDHFAQDPAKKNQLKRHVAYYLQQELTVVLPTKTIKLSEINNKLYLLSTALLNDYGVFFSDEPSIYQPPPIKDKIVIDSPFYKAWREKNRNRLTLPIDGPTQRLDQNKIKYKLAKENRENFAELAKFSPRAIFFINYSQYLLKLKKQLQKSKKIKRSKFKKIITQFYGVGKWLIDLAEDLWNSLRRFIPIKLMEAIGPFITGGIGFILACCEGWRGFKEKDVAGKVTCVLSGFMFVASVCYGFRLHVPARFIFPVIISGLMCGVYVTNFFKQCNYFTKARRDYKSLRLQKAQWKEDVVKQKQQLLELRTYINDLKKGLLIESNARVKLKLSKELRELTTQENALFINYKSTPKNIEKLKVAKANYIKAERKLAASVIEMAGSALGVIGTIMGISLIVGSILSGGMLPLGLTLISAAIGVGLQIFEFIDKKYDHKPSKKIRHFFKSLFQRSNSKAPSPSFAMTLGSSTTATIHSSLATQPRIHAPNNPRPPAGNSGKTLLNCVSRPFKKLRLHFSLFQRKPNDPHSVDLPRPTLSV